MLPVSWFLSRPAGERSDFPRTTLGGENVKGKSRSITQNESADFNFDDIVTRFNDLTSEVARLEKESQDQKSQIQKYLSQLQLLRKQSTQTKKSNDSELRKLRDNLKHEHDALATLQLTIATPEKIFQLKQDGPSQPFVKLLKEERDSAVQQIAVLRNNLDRSNDEIAALRQQVHETSLRNEELKLDLEFIKCTTQFSPTSTKMGQVGSDATTPSVAIPDVPFVLVLIDGDAYQFTTMLPNPYAAEPSMHPATRMAINIKTQLQTYIASHQLPTHCKLLVRVLINASGFKSVPHNRHNTTNSTPALSISPSRRGGRQSHHINHHIHNVRTNTEFYKQSPTQASALDEFMVRFTESDPTFEFFDAGWGKERVDSKIHELYNTFLPNPSCHKIFLACTRDNGFARMLEPHIHHPVARAKTCLISAGDVAQEIERLQLETIEWPTVFARQFQPRDTVAGIERREARKTAAAERVRIEKEELVKKLGVAGYEEVMRRRAFQTLTREMVGAREVDGIVRDLKRSRRNTVGLRTDIAGTRQSSAVDLEEDGIVVAHEGLCAEVGVD